MKTRKSAIVTLVCLFLFVFSGIAAADQVVRIPYMAHDSAGGWAAGIAITNYAGTDIEDLTLDIVTSTGKWYWGGIIAKSLEGDRESLALPSTVTNYRKDLGTLTDYAMKVGTLSSLYGRTLPTTEKGRYWCEIWHPGAEKFGVTVFIVNSNSGSGEGFGFQTYDSISRTHTFSEHTEMIVDGPDFPFKEPIDWPFEPPFDWPFEPSL